MGCMRPRTSHGSKKYPMPAGVAHSDRAIVPVFGAPLDHGAAIARSHTLLRVIESTLSARRFLGGQDITIADIAGYTYIAHAPEGGVDLEPYRAIRIWLARIEALPGFVGMARSPLPEGV